MEKVKEVLSFLTEISEDISVSKTVKTKVKSIISVLNDESLEIEIRIDKSLQQLDEISEDVNIPSFTRTQIWNAVSLLESTQFKH